MVGREQKHSVAEPMRLPCCRRFFHLLGLLGLSLLVLACQANPRQVRGEPPLISLENLILNTHSATLQVAVRNVNDRRLELASVQLNLVLDQRQAANVDLVPINLGIPSRGRDVFDIEVELDPASRQLLTDLTQDQRNNLAWQLELVFDPPRARQRAEASGFLHPVPGQPGRFR